MAEQKNLIAVGEILGTHGIKGALKVLSLSDIQDRFQQLERVFLVNNASGECIEAKLDSVFKHKGLEIVKFKEWDDINQVEGYKNWMIKIPKAERPELQQGEYYIDEIIGLDVYDQSGNWLGEIVHVFPTGSNDVYEIAPGQENRKHILIPALKKVVTEIDFDQGYMMVDPPEGLIVEEE